MYKILVVEDEENMRLGLGDNLEFEGYEVDLAEQGEKGLEKLRNNSYDLVLLDVMLPKLSGFDILKTIRKEGVTTPVILLTAKGEELDKVRGLELGADDYITKPFSLRELLARVKTALRRPPMEAVPESMRVLAAIMFTDIVGYTELMGKDEQLALKVIDENQKVIAQMVKQFNGKWLKDIGDGNLSSFRSASDAVNCSMAIQVALKEAQYQLRVGIHLGDVVFKSGDVFGDGVNIAARIEHSEEGGGIYVSEPVFDNVKNKEGLNAEFLGEKNLKNVEKPVKIYKILY